MDIQIYKNRIIAGSESKPMLCDVFFDQLEKNLPVVIYVHGFNGFKDWGNFDLIATQFAKAGFFFIKFNLSHNGTTVHSPEDFDDLEAYGQNNYTKELVDIEQILNWVASDENEFESNIDLSKITLLGHSRGGGMAILKSAEDKRVSSLITWASISACKTPWGSWSEEKMVEWKNKGVMYYNNQRTKQQMPLYYQLHEDYQNNSERLNIEQAAKRLNIPFLICHGTVDLAVPFASAELLHRWQPNSVLFSVDSDHVFGRSHPWTHDYLPEAMQKVVDMSISFISGNQ